MPSTNSRKERPTTPEAYGRCPRCGVFAEVEVLGHLSIQEYLVEDPPSTYMRLVDDDSLKGVGLLKGDLAIIERRSQAEAGDIVVRSRSDALVLEHLSVERCSGKTDVVGVVVGMARRVRAP